MERRTIPGKLAATAVKNAKPKEKPYKMADGGGLYLLVNPNGKKYWRFKYRIGTKEKLLALGVYPEVTLSEARENTLGARALLRKGIDPNEQRKLNKLELQEDTFETVAKEWWAKEKGHWSEKHADRVWQTISDTVLGEIGSVRISKVTPQQCLAIIKKIDERGALDVAKRVRQRILNIYRYAISTGRARHNPVAELDDIITKRKVTHRAALKKEELPLFLKELDNNSSITNLTQLALKLLILTFVRPGELRAARWEEFDFNSKEWRIPASRMKMNEEHIVPLSDQTIAVLKELKEVSGNFDLVFPGSHNWRKPMSDNTLTYAIRKRLNFNATAHGFRAVASTVLNEDEDAGFRSEVIERQLAHRERNKVRAAYNRAQYLKERREMMQWWGNYLEKNGMETLENKRDNISNQG